MIAGFAVVSGAVGLFNVGTQSSPIDVLLPEALVAACQVTFLVSGILMLLGIGWGKARFEAFGLVVLIGAVVIRFIAAWVVVGLNADVIVALVFYLMMAAACATRLGRLVRGDVVVQVLHNGHGDIE